MWRRGAAFIFIWYLLMNIVAAELETKELEEEKTGLQNDIKGNGEDKEDSIPNQADDGKGYSTDDCLKILTEKGIVQEEDMYYEDDQREEIISFQLTMSLEPSGECDEKTMKKMLSIDWNELSEVIHSESKIRRRRAVSDSTVGVDMSSISDAPAADMSSVSDAPAADMSSVSDAPAADMSSVSDVPAADMSSVSDAPAADMSSVSDVPAADMSSVSDAPAADMSSVSDAPAADMSSVSDVPAADMSSVSDAPAADMSSVSDVPAADMSSVSDAPAADMSSDAPAADMSSVSDAAGGSTTTTPSPTTTFTPPAGPAILINGLVPTVALNIPCDQAAGMLDDIVADLCNAHITAARSSGFYITQCELESFGCPTEVKLKLDGYFLDTGQTITLDTVSQAVSAANVQAALPPTVSYTVSGVSIEPTTATNCSAVFQMNCASIGGSCYPLAGGYLCGCPEGSRNIATTSDTIICIPVVIGGSTTPAPGTNQDLIIGLVVGILAALIAAGSIFCCFAYLRSLRVPGRIARIPRFLRLRPRPPPQPVLKPVAVLRRLPFGRPAPRFNGGLPQIRPLKRPFEDRPSLEPVYSRPRPYPPGMPSFF